MPMVVTNRHLKRAVAVLNDIKLPNPMILLCEIHSIWLTSKGAQIVFMNYLMLDSIVV
jgi:hypothetical protein